MSARARRLRRLLLTVLLCDASTVAALTALAVRARSRSSGTAFPSIARVGAASLLPGIVAVAREGRAHGRAATEHRMTGTVLLFCAGVAVNTAGTIAVLVRGRRGAALRPAETRADIALLIGGDVIAVPYLLVVRALHRTG